MSGCAPRLRFLIPGLFHRQLDPHLSMLTSPETLLLEFRSNPPRSHPEWEGLSPPPSTRSVLLTHTYFQFKVISEYSEDLVTRNRVDAPRLNHLDVTFFNQIDVDTPLLAKFISFMPTFRILNGASVFFHDSLVFESTSVMALHPLVLLGHNTMLSQIGRALIVSLQPCPVQFNDAGRALHLVLCGSCIAPHHPPTPQKQLPN